MLRLFAHGTWSDYKSKQLSAQAPLHHLDEEVPLFCVLFFIHPAIVSFVYDNNNNHAFSSSNKLEVLIFPR